MPSNAAEPSLDGRTVVVTGASRGMGRSMALRFAEEGANVALLARDAEALSTVAEAAGGETLVVPTDVTEAEQVRDAVDRTLDAYGSVDVVVNNAGVSLTGLEGVRKSVVDITAEEWDTVIGTNLTGVFLVTRRTLPAMLDRGWGNLINVSSGLGRRPAPRWEPYLTSKWGLEGFTRSLALEVAGTGLTVNGMDPGGGVDTDIAGHVPAEERRKRPGLDVMNDAAVLLAAQEPGGVSGQSMSSSDWEDVLSG